MQFGKEMFSISEHVNQSASKNNYKAARARNTFCGDRQFLPRRKAQQFSTTGWVDS